MKWVAASAFANYPLYVLFRKGEVLNGPVPTMVRGETPEPENESS
jgi:hypothetical protein